MMSIADEAQELIDELTRLRALEAAVVGHWQQCVNEGSTMKDLNWWLGNAGYLERIDHVIELPDETITVPSGAWQLTAKHREVADEWIVEEERQLLEQIASEESA